MKVESAVDVQNEGDPFAVQLPSAFSIMKAESEVSCDFRRYFLLFQMFVYVFLCLCIVHVVYYMTLNECLEEYCSVRCNTV